ncbi:Thiol disulfide oxidoreductase TlpA [Caenispirillum salinarum AK4]|uniref:Thiol disulfide oxidoreductase TlpA n=1 Tax=Caenispirillum salinarum AK4 TaxID=1238182 RepID=K9HVR5_9PROT|nr:TlpA disulfide reductase family protein [Caenispirillum salinarum]EKV32331.1 Thiol disulfide oxidoreductase TlpA [Caenispirillum salinarum AK4]
MAAEINGVTVPFMVKVTNPDPLPQEPFLNADGEEITLADFEGQVVVLNFWATWCAPCVKEMPDLDALAEATADDPITVIALNEDRKPLEVAPAWLREQGLDHLEVFADQRQGLARAFQIRGMPTTVLIGPEGEKLAYREGIAEWADPDFIAALRKLAERAPADG